MTALLKHDDVRENAVMFNIGVSAAAQYMIYSASNVFEFCERERTSLRHLGWGKWKAGFKEAQTNPLINASGKSHATLAVAAMNEAEMGLESPSGAAAWDGPGETLEKSQLGNPKETRERGMERTHDEAFSGVFGVMEGT